MKASNSLKTTNKCAVASGLVGLALSWYAYYVELKKEDDANYEAWCDINENMSCSKAFMSEYGKGFGIVRFLVGEDSDLNIPNCLAGIFFYAVIIVLNTVNNITWTKVLIGLNIISNIISVYLAYILFFILHDICVVCLTTYLVNVINLLLSVIKLRALHAPKASSGRKRKKKN